MAQKQPFFTWEKRLSKGKGHQNQSDSLCLYISDVSW